MQPDAFTRRMADGFSLALEGRLIAGLVTLLVASLFVYVAARFVIDRSSLFASILTVLVGTFVASLLAGLVPGMLGIILGVAAWALAAAIFFRTDWIKGAIIGLVAAVLWIIVTYVVGILTA